MLPRLYETSIDKSSYAGNGLGFIKYCKKCEITEELNGEYTLSMTVHPWDNLADKIKVNRIIKAKSNSTDKPQLFEITKHVVQTNGEIEITGQHIKYLGLQNCMFRTSTFPDSKNGTPQEIADFLFENLYFDNLFTFYSDITDKVDFKLSDIESKKLGDVFGGSDYSLISEFGGEFHYDNFNISFLKKRGSDSDFKLMFGKNISDFNQTISNDTCYSHIVAFAKVSKSDENTTVVVCGEPYLTNQNQVFPKVKFIDKTEDINNEWATIPHYLSHPAYYQNYFRANIIKAQIYKYLTSQLGLITENKATAEFLNSNLFKYGESIEEDDLITQFTGEAFTQSYT